MKVELGQRSNLWLLVDHVYLKPLSRVDITLHIEPLDQLGDSSSAFLKNPEDRALFQVVCDCIREQVNKEVGYEANLAHLEYQVKKYGDVGV